MRTSMACKKSYDYVVVGGGFAGMNALRAIHHASPKSSVLCIDKNSQPGGSWNDYYPFVKLHTPHQMFGVNGHPWHHKDRNLLSTRDDVLRHFNDFRKTLPSNFEFAWEVSCNAWHKRQDGRMDVDVEKVDGTSCVDAHCVIDAKGFDYCGHMQRSACKHAAGPNDINEISVNELPTEVERRKASGKDALYVIIGGGKTGMDAAIFVAKNRGANDESVVIIGSPKYFYKRDNFWNPSRYNIFFPAWSEKSSFLITEYDGTEASALELLQRAEDSDLLLRVGEAKPDQCFNGFMSVAEKETVERSAQLVPNDYFVRCEDSGVGSRRLVLSSGKTLETKKEVVLVNCRSSLWGRENVFTQDVHPLRPDGSLRPGTHLALTGTSAYGITLLHLKGKSDISLYGAKNMFDSKRMKFTAQGAVEVWAKVTGNMMFKLGAAIGSDELGKVTLNSDYWLPALRKAYATSKMMWNADKIKAACDKNLEALQPYK